MSEKRTIDTSLLWQELILERRLDWLHDRATYLEGLRDAHRASWEERRELVEVLAKHARLKEKIFKLRQMGLFPVWKAGF